MASSVVLDDVKNATVDTLNTLVPQLQGLAAYAAACRTAAVLTAQGGESAPAAVEAVRVANDARVHTLPDELSWGE